MDYTMSNLTPIAPKSDAGVTADPTPHTPHKGKSIQVLAPVSRLPVSLKPLFDTLNLTLFSFGKKFILISIPAQGDANYQSPYASKQH